MATSYDIFWEIVNNPLEIYGKQLIEDYANQRVAEELTKAAHNACQMLLLEEITPSLAFEVQNTIIQTLNQK